ncbi:Rrf2 family transcriptional regulator [Variovorax sp. J22R133]|uniref:Rrf2 family transcriptional regulator n=1 Tax=Variovorax brevis TaxID=3053503 RepID=UPI0025763A0A|nr:Rrf2 family transcriptional regulator [Variovorax sp. J22R133]MDM0116088.1 Rrf2 family transcriptional regulator [Variovorax sp. J22R133]
MASSTRFALAVHILSYLAIRGQSGPLTSERIALSVNTNPALIRKLLSSLADAGLTRSQMGSGGGAQLAKEPQDITLLDVYKAVEAVRVFHLHRTAPSPACLVGRNISQALGEVSDLADRAVEVVLGGTTLADVDASIMRSEKKRERVRA